MSKLKMREQRMSEMLTKMNAAELLKSVGGGILYRFEKKVTVIISSIFLPIFFTLTVFLPVSAFAFSIGDRVIATANVNVRSCASTSCSIYDTAQTGYIGTIKNGPYSGSGYTWWYISWDEFYTGYSVQDYLTVIFPPTVTTNAASSITYNSATLNGTVNPNGLSTSVYFQWGTTTSYGNASSVADAGSGTTTTSWQNVLTGLLSPSTTYNFRFVAYNSAGTTYGSNRTFTTDCSSSYSISPTNNSFTASGGTGSVSVTGGTCSWTASNNASWITITSGSSGSGNGTVSYSVSSNCSSSRSGTITIAGQTFTISQSGDSTAPSNGTLSASGGSGQVSLSWSGFSDSCGIANYQLVYSTGSYPSSCSSGTQIYSGSNTSYTHTGLSSSTTYYYRVCATDNAGNISTGATKDATTSIIYYTLTTFVSPSGGGSVSPSCSGGCLYSSGTYVTITATANSGYTFNYWSGCDSTSGTTCYATMNSSKYVYAYFIDAQAPSNPTSTSGYSTSSKTTSITSGSWYNYSAPYFEWSGASDTGSGIAGYYVYFGTSSTADPATSGTYQTGSTYTSTLTLSSGSTYYLLIKARDNAGNTASSTYTAFTYKYDSTSPSNTTATNFINSGATSTNSATVTLNLSATDSVGVTGYYVADNSTGTTPSTPSSTATGWVSVTSAASYIVPMFLTHSQAVIRAGLPSMRMSGLKILRGIYQEWQVIV
jgi:hypothetical protein